MKNIQPLSLAIFVFSLTVAVGGWFLLVPGIRTMANQLNQVHQLNDRYASMNVPTNSQGQDATKLAALKTQAETLLPVGDNQYDLLIQVDAAGKDQGLPFSTLSITPTDPAVTTTTGIPLPGSTKGVVLNLGNTASYTDTGRLLQSLLSLNRLMKVDQLTLSTAKASTGGLVSGPLSVNINATALYLPVVAATPAPKK